MAPRTDIHRPSALKVEDYDFIKFDYLPSDGDVLGNAMFLAEERKRFMAHMAATGAHYGENHSAGSCYICGAHAIYTATFHHRPTNRYICTGLDCGEKLDGGDAEGFKKKVRTALEAVAGKRKAKAVLEKAGAAGAWTIYEADIANRAAYKVECDEWRKANPEPKLVPDKSGYGAIEVGAPKFKGGGKDELTVLDMVERLIKYGNISDRAMNYLKVLVERIAKAPEIAKARAAENAAAAPVPVVAGRMKVEGEVLSIKTTEGHYGVQTKMLVKSATGYKVWGTVPASILNDVARGDRVTFFATVKASEDDEKFGFFSRPSQALVIKQKEDTPT